MALILLPAIIFYFADSNDELRPEAFEHLYDVIKLGECDVATSGYDLLVSLLQQGDFIFLYLLEQADFKTISCRIEIPEYQTGGSSVLWAVVLQNPISIISERSPLYLS